MDFDEIKRLTSSAQASTSATRDEASEMLVFGRINQWDDVFSGMVANEFRGQFDIVKSKRNKIIAELHANPTSVDFKAKDGADPDAAEVLNGMFRSDMIYGEEAIETAQMDMVDCGYGAFRFTTEYESKEDDLDNLQRIKVEPINEANNVVYMDDNARKKDKSDAYWGLIITPFTREGWQKYCKENGIDYDEHKDPGSYQHPNSDRGFFLRNTTKHIDIGEFYHKERKRKRVLIFENPYTGERVSYYQSDIKKVIDELEESGFVQIGQKYRDRFEVTKYLLSGQGIIKKQKIAGEEIPIVCMFGDWSYVEKRELWRGIYHDAQDAQRLYNTAMSYMMDIWAKGPREKPIFLHEQIQGYERYYHQNGMDNNYPYMMQNRLDQDGGELPLGPVGYLQNPQVPPTVAATIDKMKESVNDVTGSSMNTADMLNSQVTEGQIAQVNASTNMETFLYRNSYQLAMKQAGRIYVSMARELYDVPREVTVTNADGSEKTMMVNSTVLDMETGEEVVLNDLTKGRFEVFAETGPSYTSLRQEQAQKMSELFQSMPDSEVGQMALMSYLTTLEGPDMDWVRKYGRNQLVLGGHIEPETDEEKQMVMQAQQQAQMQAQQPDPAMLMAMAEDKKGQAAMQDAMNDQAKVQVDAFNAESKRMDSETKRMEAINKGRNDTAKTASEIKGNELDNVQKLAQSLMPQGFMIQ